MCRRVADPCSGKLIPLWHDLLRAVQSVRGNHAGKPAMAARRQLGNAQGETSKMMSRNKQADRIDDFGPVLTVRQQIIAAAVLGTMIFISATMAYFVNS
jgi:hypothetical protein